TMNIMTGENHGDIDKNDNEDPTLSYGIHKKYQCYQCSELEGSFRYDNDLFIFEVPDWRTNGIGIKEFPISSINNLLQLLTNSNNNNIEINKLINKIKEGLKYLSSAKIKQKVLIDKFNTFNDKQKHIIELYFAWMFFYAMYMRFWKGPHYQWPIKQQYFGQTSAPERNEYVYIQHGVKTTIIEMYENDEDLKLWIDSLPKVNFYFDDEDKVTIS